MQSHGTVEIHPSENVSQVYMFSVLNNMYTVYNIYKIYILRFSVLGSFVCSLGCGYVLASLFLGK